MLILGGGLGTPSDVKNTPLLKKMVDMFNTIIHLIWKRGSRGTLGDGLPKYVVGALREYGLTSHLGLYQSLERIHPTFIPLTLLKQITLELTTNGI